MPTHVTCTYVALGRWLDAPHIRHGLLHSLIRLPGRRAVAQPHCMCVCRVCATRQWPWRTCAPCVGRRPLHAPAVRIMIRMRVIATAVHHSALQPPPPPPRTMTPLLRQRQAYYTVECAMAKWQRARAGELQMVLELW